MHSVRQLYLFQSFTDSLLSFCCFDSLVQKRQFNIFLCSKPGQEIKILKDKPQLMIAYPGQLPFRILLNGNPVQNIFPLVCHIQTADNIHHCGFSASGGTDDTDKFSLLDAHAGMIQSVYRFISNGIYF